MADLIDHLPFSEYAQAPGQNKTYLCNILKSPAHYQAAKAAPHKDTRAINIGLALHCKLSDDRHCLAVAPQVDKRTKAGKAAFAEFEAESTGKVIVTPEVDDQTEAMHEAIMTHPIAGQWAADGRHEVSAFFDLQEVPCKARVDCLLPEAIVDWKTIGDMDRVQHTAAGFHYDFQAAFYQEAIRQATGQRVPFYFVFVETSPPFGVQVLEAGETMMDRGMTNMHRAIELYKQCREQGVWPGYPAEIGTLELPGYAQLRTDDVIAW